FPRDIAATLAVSPDGSTLAVASGPNTRKLYLWRWQAGEEPRELGAPGHRSRFLAFSPDGRLLLDCDDGDVAIRVWDVARGRVVHKLVPPEADHYRSGSITFTPDGKTLITSSH